MQEILQKKCVSSKQAGLNGFLIYNQMAEIPKIVSMVPKNLIEYHPKAFPVLSPANEIDDLILKRTVGITLEFIQKWIRKPGVGNFVTKEGDVVDSATAEIARWQVHQWIQKQVRLC